jgi:cellulose synthase/poly-beta-1,6-N-acetylglucosamine synthase-like glycosyltransferase
VIVLYAIWLAVILILGAAAWITLYITLAAWRTPQKLEATRFHGDGSKPVNSYSLLVPARHEEAVLEGTLERIMGINYPNFEVVCIVGDDDPETRGIAEQVAARYPGRLKVAVDDSPVKNKPKALNRGLKECTGDIVGIFDAEDVVHPDVLARVEQSFHADDADVVQGGVQLMNYQSSWFSVRNVLEYYFWFRSRLHFHSDVGFIPLGGNTVFVKSGILHEVGGWDPESLTEDCDLGTKLSAEGAKVVVAYDPELATREETPDTVGALIRQRTRWNQGFLQVLRKGDWKKMKGGQKALALYTLGFPIVAAIAAVMIPIAIITSFAIDTPMGYTMLLFAPLVPLVALVVSEMIGLRDFCNAYDLPARFIDYFWVLVGTIPYWLVLGYAAARAVLREMTGTRNWEKTAHTGSHVQVSEQATAQIPAGDAQATQPMPQTVAAMSATGPGGTGAGGGYQGESPYPSAAASGAEPPPVDTTPPAGGSLAVAGAGGAVAASGGGLDLGESPKSSLLSATTFIVGALIIILAIVQARGAGLSPSWFLDEGQYVNNAWAVENWEGLSNYTYFYDHPPLGWITVAGWAFITGAFERTGAIATGREVALIAHTASMILIYIVGRRLGIRPMWAGLGVVLFTLSPLAFENHRVLWLDNLAMPWALLAIALALSPQKKLWAFAGSGAALAIATLNKETCLLLLPAVLVAAYMNADERTRRFCMGLFFSFLGTLVGGWLLYAALRGELFSGEGHVSLWDGMKFQLIDRPSSGSVFDSGSLAYAQVESWLDVDPWLLGVGVLLTPIALLWSNLRPIGVGLVVYLIVLAIPGYLAPSFVVALLPLAALAIVGTLELISRAGGGIQWGVAAVVLIAAVAIAPGWWDANRDVIEAEAAAPQEAASEWVASNVPKSAAIMTDDTIWADLVEVGFIQESVHPFHKPDLDREVKVNFSSPADFDYVISTRAVREGVLAPELVIARATHQAATPVAQFGEGRDRVEVRQVAATG